MRDAARDVGVRRLQTRGTDGRADLLEHPLVCLAEGHRADEHRAERESEVAQQVRGGARHAREPHGTVLIATAVMEPTVSAKPQPRISMGGMKRGPAHVMDVEGRGPEAADGHQQEAAGEDPLRRHVADQVGDHRNEHEGRTLDEEEEHTDGQGVLVLDGAQPDAHREAGREEGEHADDRGDRNHRIGAVREQVQMQQWGLGAQLDDDEGGEQNQPRYQGGDDDRRSEARLGALGGGVEDGDQAEGDVACPGRSSLRPSGAEESVALVVMRMEAMAATITTT